MRGIVAGLLLALAGTAVANDTAVVGQGGRWKRQSAGKTSVQMVRETISMTIDQESSYAVQADFEFRNTGASTTVQMGFPEFGGGDMSGEDWKKKTAFKNFETFVDGHKVPAVRQVAEAAEEFYDAFWVKTVKFGKSQTRKVRVKYRAPYGGMAAFTRNFCLYSFTGGNWHGKVQSSVLTVRIAIPGAYIAGIEKTTHQPVFVRKGQDFIYSWKNWEAEDYLKFRFVRTTPDWLAWKDRDPREPGLFAVKIPGEKLGKVQWAPAGFVREGRTYVRFSDLVDHAKEKGQSMTGQWTSNSLSVNYGGKKSQISRAGGKELFALITEDGSSTYYVSIAKISQDLKIGFKTDLKTHMIDVLL